MRVPLLPALILLLIGVLIDIYIYRRMRRYGASRMWCAIHCTVAVVVSGALLAVTVFPKKSAGDAMLDVLMWTAFAYLSVYFPKFVAALFLLVQQALGRIMHRPLRGIGIAGATVATAIFGLLWWGALINRYNIDVREVEVDIDGLPEAFDGYRIVQLSDIHTGSYGHDDRFLQRVTDAANGANADIILFTGDIVNRHSAELRPFMGALSRLDAPDGVVSVLGNHDYGDYYRWPSEQAHRADVDTLCRLQRAMGWQMLNNSHRFVHRGSDSIAIIGVENIGEPPFSVHGDLGRAYPALADSTIKILMTHNPRHWTDSIAGDPDARVALTLSGHTHAMQCELFGASPAALRYPTWGGLYTDSLGRHLYVNIGIGEVGMPARIGATPEVTVITLRKKQQ